MKIMAVWRRVTVGIMMIVIVSGVLTPFLASGFEISGTLEPLEGLEIEKGYTFSYQLTNIGSEQMRVEGAYIYFDWDLPNFGYECSQHNIIIESGDSHTFSWAVDLSEVRGVIEPGNHVATVEILASDPGVWSEWDIPDSQKYTYTVNVEDTIPEDSGEACSIIIPLLIPIALVSVSNIKHRE